MKLKPLKMCLEMKLTKEELTFMPLMIYSFSLLPKRDCFGRFAWALNQDCFGWLKGKFGADSGWINITSQKNLELKTKSATYYSFSKEVRNVYVFHNYSPNSFHPTIITRMIREEGGLKIAYNEKIYEVEVPTTTKKS